MPLLVVAFVLPTCQLTLGSPQVVGDVTCVAPCKCFCMLLKTSTNRISFFVCLNANVLYMGVILLVLSLRECLLHAVL